MKIVKTFLGLLLAAFAVQSVQAAGPTNIVWRLPHYSLTARAMDVRNALDTFGVAEGIPVVQSPVVKGLFSGDFRRVPASEFLDRLTTMHNLTWYYDGASIFISGAGETLTTLIDLRYMKASEVTAMLRQLGVEDARFPLKTASDGELIMVSGPPRYVSLVAEMIAKADKLREMRTFNEIEVKIFPLVNTWADTVSFNSSGPESTLQIRGVAEILQEIMSARGGTKTRDGTNNVDSAENRINSSNASGFTPLIRADNRLNAVVVRDVATRMPMYADLIRQLDKPQKLVEIGVTVVELTKKDALDWQLSLQVSGAKSEFSGAAGQNVDNLASPDSLGGQGLAGAFTYLGRDVDVSASLSALRTKGKARNISRSSLLTLNNLSAEMSDQQSYHAKVVGEKVASLQEVSAGTLLQIKPRIVEPPKDSTNVTAQVWLTMKLQDGGFETITVDSMPMTRTSTVETQASLPDGNSLLLAGYLRDIEEDVGWGIPYLRDIPWIGWIFGGASRGTETVQRFFILTPHVITMQQPDTIITQAVNQRSTFVEDDIEDALNLNDVARKLRKLDHQDLREQRELELEEKLERREAEVDRDRQFRDIDKSEAKEVLKADKRTWYEAIKARREAYVAAQKAREDAAKKAAAEKAEAAKAAGEPAKPAEGEGEKENAD